MQVALNALATKMVRLTKPAIRLPVNVIVKKELQDFIVILAYLDTMELYKRAAKVSMPEIYYYSPMGTVVFCKYFYKCDITKIIKKTFLNIQLILKYSEKIVH